MEKIYPSLSELFTGYLDEVEPSHRNMDANAMKGICPSMREFKDNQEIELVIKVPLQDREGNPRD